MVYRVTKVLNTWVLRPDADPLCGLDYHATKGELLALAELYVEQQGGLLIVEDDTGREESKRFFGDL
jgi:hypothetical protein